MQDNEMENKALLNKSGRMTIFIISKQNGRSKSEIHDEMY